MSGASASPAPIAETPPVACADCAQGHVWTGAPTGSELRLGDFPAYYAAPENADSKGAILFLHDAFGWKFPNNRLLCDWFAKDSGCHVYLPDFFDGTTIVTEEQAAILLDPKPTIVGKILQGLRMTVALPSFIIHIMKFGVAKTQPSLDKVVADIKARHGGEECKLGAVGYCWGGKYSLRLGAQGKVAAAIACHPSVVKVQEDSLKESKAPTLFNLAQHDELMPEKLWAEIEAAMKESGVVYEKVVFPGTRHGFATRCSETDLQASQARDEAFDKSAAWFAMYLR